MEQMGNLDQIVRKIYAALCLIIHSIDICEMLSSIISYNRQINVIFKFTEKSSFGENLIRAKFGRKLCNLRSHGLI